MSTDYSKIPGDRRATFKQVNSSGYILGAILQKELGIPDNSPITGRRLAGRLRSAVVAHHEGNLTHGEYQRYRAMETIPASIRKRVKLDDLHALLTADGHDADAILKTKPQAKAKAKAKPKSRRAATSKAKAVKVEPEIETAGTLTLEALAKQIGVLTAAITRK